MFYTATKSPATSLPAELRSMAGSFFDKFHGTQLLVAEWNRWYITSSSIHFYFVTFARTCCLFKHLM